jgi:hypothetical protein
MESVEGAYARNYFVEILNDREKSSEAASSGPRANSSKLGLPSAEPPAGKCTLAVAKKRRESDESHVWPPPPVSQAVSASRRDSSAACFFLASVG